MIAGALPRPRQGPEAPVPRNILGVAESIQSAMTYKDEMGPLPHSAKSLHGMHAMLEKAIDGLRSMLLYL